MVLKVAFCIYGEFRTFEYCLPWLIEMMQPHRFVQPIEFDFFFFVKLFSSSRYSDRSDIVPAPVNALDLMMQFSPKKFRFTHQDDPSEMAVRDVFNRGGVVLHSLSTVINLKHQHEIEQGIQYDYCVLKRTDTLTGPDIGVFANILNSIRVEPATIYAQGRNFKSPGDLYVSGMQDTFLIADSPTMNRLSFELADVYNYLDDKALDYSDNTHVALKAAINNIGIDVQNIIGLDMIVRLNGDLSIPVLESFDIHREFYYDELVKDGN